MESKGLDKQLLGEAEQRKQERIARAELFEHSRLMRRLGIKHGIKPLLKLRTRKPLPGQLELF